ncbi:unnamed protein product [Miscanthus lutarioriparius]|uniref:Leucine-rich repeat-containing N-terminal plant-type domain-containing protein n=1 Tax=Miscanthus lutarioriparius TaxID=422564 RepID=A0A811QGC3_9POAL|nr:unnamed protein product [Miscanthus lutarioriparius]
MLDRRAAMLVLFSCFLFLTTHAQQQPQPAASGNRKSPSCIPHERDALLAFKQGVTWDPAGRLNSWQRDGDHGEHDCCRWRGVRCSNRTGRSIRFGRPGKSFFACNALDHLEHLDLSENELEGPTGHIPKFLGSLKYVNLSGILLSRASTKFSQRMHESKCMQKLLHNVAGFLFE